MASDRANWRVVLYWLTGVGEVAPGVHAWRITTTKASGASILRRSTFHFVASLRIVVGQSYLYATKQKFGKLIHSRICHSTNQAHPGLGLSETACSFSDLSTS
jgi:hypothetical protein